MSALKTQVNTNLPDNTTKQISPADTRGAFLDFLDTMTPAYGAMTITSANGVIKNLSSMPVILTWEAVSPDTTAEYTCTTSTGSIARAGNSANRVEINLEAYAPAGRIVTARLYNGNTATQWRFSGVGQGVSKPTSIVFAAVFRMTTFSLDLRFTIDGAAVDVTFKNGVIYCNDIPMVQ